MSHPIEPYNHVPYETRGAAYRRLLGTIPARGEAGGRRQVAGWSDVLLFDLVDDLREYTRSTRPKVERAHIETGEAVWQDRTPYGAERFLGTREDAINCFANDRRTRQAEVSRIRNILEAEVVLRQVQSLAG